MASGRKSGTKLDSAGVCEMCGNAVAIIQGAHIVAEGSKRGANILDLCPTCHLMFDTHLKPRLYKALNAWNRKRGRFDHKWLPESWKTSIYDQTKPKSVK